MKRDKNLSASQFLSKLKKNTVERDQLREYLNPTISIGQNDSGDLKVSIEHEECDDPERIDPDDFTLKVYHISAYGVRVYEQREYRAAWMTKIASIRKQIENWCAGKRKNFPADSWNQVQGRTKRCSKSSGGNGPRSCLLPA